MGMTEKQKARLTQVGVEYDRHLEELHKRREQFFKDAEADFDVLMRAAVKRYKYQCAVIVAEGNAEKFDHDPNPAWLRDAVAKSLAQQTDVAMSEDGGFLIPNVHPEIARQFFEAPYIDMAPDADAPETWRDRPPLL